MFHQWDFCLSSESVTHENILIRTEFIFLHCVGLLYMRAALLVEGCSGVRRSGSVGCLKISSHYILLRVDQVLEDLVV